VRGSIGLDLSSARSSTHLQHFITSLQSTSIDGQNEENKQVTRVPSSRRINYALYEELEADDPERTRDVYRECLRMIPHSKFSFSKIWIMAAQFEIRQKNLAAARKILGQAIGRAPKDKVRISLP
jgi:hypothetical protein